MRPRRPALRPSALLLALLVAACGEDVTAPQAPGPETEEPATVASDMSVDLVVSDLDAGSGETVTVAAEVSAGDVTPTGFVAALGYDPARLAPAGEVEIEEGEGLRVVNLRAGEGSVRAAGAAADGFAESTLFALRMEVRKGGWANSLRLEMEELDIVENGFADMAARIPAVGSAVEGSPLPATGGEPAAAGGDERTLAEPRGGGEPDRPGPGTGSSLPDRPSRGDPGGS